MMTRPKKRQALNKIRASWLKGSARLDDHQLLCLVLCNGTSRQYNGRTTKTWGVFDLASDLLHEAGGRLEHLVASACRDDLDLRHFGLGKVLGSRLLAAMELAQRWRRGLGNAVSLRLRKQIELASQVLAHKDKLSTGELLVVLWSDGPREQKKLAPLLASYSSAEDLLPELTPEHWAGHVGGVLAGSLPISDSAASRLLAAVELARRHRDRADFEKESLKSGALGLRSTYLLKLLDPESPIDRGERRRLLDQARTNAHLAADRDRLDRLASAAGTDDWEQAIKLHAMFETLRLGEWRHPADLLGKPVPYRGLMSIAEAKLDRNGTPSSRILEIKKHLESAARAAARQPACTFAETLLGLGLSPTGLEAALAEVRQRFEQGDSPAEVR